MPLRNLGTHTEGLNMVADTQAQHAETSDILDQLLSDSVHKMNAAAVFDLTAGNITLTDDEFFGHGVFFFDGTPGASRTVTTPAVGGKRFAAINTTGQLITMKTSGVGNTEDIVAASALDMIQLGVDIYSVSASSAQGAGSHPVDLAQTIVGQPANGAVSIFVPIVRSVTIPAGAPGSRARCRTVMGGGEGDLVWNIQKNEVNVGTVTFSASTKEGVIAVASPIVLGTSDDFGLVNPASGLDTSAIRNVGFNFKVDYN